MAMQETEARQVNGRIIALFSSASAVGKTTIALNLATWLKQQAFRTVVVDLDLQFGDVCHYLKIVPQCTIHDYQRALEQSRESSAAPFLVGGTGVPDILPAPFDIAEAYNLKSDTVTRLLGEFKSTYDYIFVDLVSGFSDVNLKVLEAANLIYFVGLVDFIPTIKNMKAAYETMQGLGIPLDKIRLILNRNNAKTDIELRDVEALLGRTFYHTLPNDFAKSAAAIKKGLPVLLTAPQSELAAALRALAEQLAGRLPSAKEKPKGMKRWFSGFLRD